MTVEGMLRNDNICRKMWTKEMLFEGIQLKQGVGEGV